MRRQVVYKFQLYSIVSDEFRTSRRYGTRTAIDAIGGKVIEDSKITIDSSEMGKDLEGFTLRDFRASSRVGFQHEVEW